MNNHNEQQIKSAVIALVFDEPLHDNDNENENDNFSMTNNAVSNVVNAAVEADSSMILLDATSNDNTEQQICVASTRPLEVNPPSPASQELLSQEEAANDKSSLRPLGDSEVLPSIAAHTLESSVASHSSINSDGQNRFLRRPAKQRIPMSTHDSAASSVGAIAVAGIRARSSSYDDDSSSSDANDSDGYNGIGRSIQAWDGLIPIHSSFVADQSNEIQSGIEDPDGTLSIIKAELVTDNTDPLVEERDRIRRETRSILASEAVRAEPLAAPHDDKQSHKVIMGSVAIMIVIAAVALVVGIQLSPSESNANEISSPTLSPTRMSTPTSAPAVYGSNGYRVFTTTSQLRTAVAAYVENARTGDLSNNSDVAVEYGYPIGTWDVSRITDFSRIFDPDPDQHLELNRNPRFTSDFDEDLSGWDVANAITMHGMFAAAHRFTGKGIEHWNVSTVSDFTYMFAKAYKFNGNIARWETSNAEKMDFMFLEAKVFNGDISSWDVFKVTSMSHMFHSASAFKGGDLREWNVSSVNNMEAMFQLSAFNGKVSTWDTSRVTNMRYTFSVSSINDDLSSWRVGNVRTMQGMFLHAALYQGGDLSRWDTSRTTDMSQIFSRAYAFQGDVSQWDVSNVVTLDSAFEEANSYDGDMSLWKTGKVQNMESMFLSAELFSGGNLSSWDTSNVVSAKKMFTFASAFNSNISNWNVSRLKDASFMFSDATSFNHSLCPWGIQLSGTVDLTEMFVDSSCVNESDPSMIDYTLGPYCANCVA